ncbi:HWE histidine kinase domain-containing protein [Methylosinus sp. Ce-a6]|uniref:PAS domain-containing sensor histidine kinase n=1 Tax=Methylosinus sp. Ce-a6 TaxID=2172005 RepID=UPI0013594A8F|nr:HWE histidine kinase domain-containing protein [Methylosinus sp. Ce-a6]
MTADAAWIDVTERRSGRFFFGDSETAAAITAANWAKSPLGLPQTWPKRLRVALEICLNSAFPIAILWGGEFCLLYNDACHGLLADKHPRALGLPAREVWPEIWDVIGPMLQDALVGGRPTRSEDLQLYTMRNGRRDEGYFTFSYSPIRDDDGTIGGVFCPVVVTTDRVIGERRLRTLRDLAALSRAENEGEACRVAASVLAANGYDVPFSAIYRFDEDRGEAELTAATGVLPGGRVAPRRIKLGDPDPDNGDLWGLDEVARLTPGRVAIRTLDARFGEPPCGPWTTPPDEAVLFPIVLLGQDRAAAALIAAVSPFKRLDAAYAYFLDRVAAKIASAMTDARAYAAERERAEEIRVRELALRRAEAELCEAQRLGRIGSWRWSGRLDDRGGASPYLARIFGLDPAAPPPSFAEQKGLLYAPADWERLDAATRETLRTGESFELDLPAHRADGAAIHVTIRGEAVRDERDAIVGLRSTIQDITERKQAQERVELLLREVTHRAKNLLTVVRAVARQTARKDSPVAFAQRFDQRIAALGASHDLLVQNEWRGVELHALTRSQLAHFRDLFGSRIHIEGPTTIVKPGASQAIGMALHELATNAGKYGALSNDEGVAHIAFGVTSESGESHFEMSWRESGGPPVAAPKRHGFGHMVILQMAKHALGGRVTLDYASSGVVWSVSAPLDNVIEPAQGED